MLIMEENTYNRLVAVQGLGSITLVLLASINPEHLKRKIIHIFGLVPIQISEGMQYCALSPANP
ncbi:MAG: hypothetical protein ACI9MF_001928 [Gammaproteobacteria bacterium]|jgi:hypothetical protein